MFRWKHNYNQPRYTLLATVYLWYECKDTFPVVQMQIFFFCVDNNKSETPEMHTLDHTKALLSLNDRHEWLCTKRKCLAQSITAFCINEWNDWNRLCWFCIILYDGFWIGPKEFSNFCSFVYSNQEFKICCSHFVNKFEKDQERRNSTKS